MKKLLFSALIIVLTLAYLAPADANSKKQNNVNCSNITQNNKNKSNTQSSNRAGQSKKCNNTVPSTKPADRGKPDNPKLPTSR